MHPFKKPIAVPFFIGLLLLTACSSANLSSGRRNTPEWVKSRPVSRDHYVGIGMASTAQDHYMKIAKKNALADLVSEISVTISGNSVLHQLENNEGFREEFESYTRTSIKDQLEGYELVDSYTDDGNHWVYYRLSIEKYRRLKREKLEKAKELAKNFFEKAQQAQGSRDIHNALNYYVKAFKAIKPHLDEDLSIFLLNKGRVNLGNAIYQNIQEIFSSLEVKPARDVFKVKALSANNEPVRATVSYQKTDQAYPVSGLPFTFSFPELNGLHTEQVQSNSSGEIVCTIAEMAPKGQQQKIRAALNTEVYFGQKSKGTMLHKLFSLNGSVPYGYLTIQVSGLQAYIKASEEAFGRSESNKPVANLFSKQLTENFFSLVSDPSDAQVIIRVTAKTTQGKKMERYDLYTAWLTCHIRVINARTQAEIYSTGLQNIKGMKTGSYRMAAMDAREKAKEQIKQIIIPELRKIKF
ncbi:MAG TPA: LPP20 family lipoprotein [Bacteroidales bacterium]|nr:LPP20 family lipoprotein [Bacteroidales bacterium]